MHLFEKTLVETSCNECLERPWISYGGGFFVVVFCFFSLLYYSKDNLKCVSTHKGAAASFVIMGMLRGF